MKGKLTQKKVLAMLLTGVLCLNLLPTLAMADTMENIEPAAIVQEEDGGNSETDLKSEDLASEGNINPSEALNDEQISTDPEGLSSGEVKQDSNLAEEENPSEEASKTQEKTGQVKENDETEMLLPQSSLLDEAEEETVFEETQAETVWDGQTRTKPETDQNGIYQIENGENLAWFAGLVNGKLSDGTAQNTSARAVLVKDIVLGNDTIETNWTPIGGSSSQYLGTFNGQGHTISGLRIADASTAYQGLFGYIGSTGVVKSITVEGNISVKANYVGGIAGQNAGTIEDCCNKSDITSTKTYAGGIAGNNLGSTSSYANLTGCYNAGSIKSTATGTVYVGGITGNNKYANIISCYNLGRIESAGASTGGVAGYGYTGSILNCYTVGTVTSTGTSNIGAVVGFLLGSSNAVLEKTYYLEGTYSSGVGSNKDNTNAIAKSSNDMKTDGFVAELGGSFVSDTTPNQNNGYPIVGWQDPNAKYIVAFDINQQQSDIEVRDSEGNLIPAEGEGIYKLNNGTYSYTVSKDEYKTAEGSFSVSNGGKKIAVNLEIKTYSVTFEELSPADSRLTVKNSAGEVLNGNHLIYQLPKGNYTYTVDKFGFQTAEGSFAVQGTELTIPKIVLAESERSLVTFEISFIDHNPSAVGSITVKHGEEVQEKGQEGNYRLADGEYTYVISCNGYKTIMGSITVKGEAVHIQKTMEIRKVWSGAAEEPSMISKDGKMYYQIVNSENLSWFSNYVNAGNTTANAVVTGNIVLSDEEQNNTWISIGSWDKPYAGIFDGQAFKITGLKGSNGLFAYSNSASIVKNIAVEGVITQASSNVGGIMGANYGKISNCAFSGSIVSVGQRVGGIAGNNSGGTIENCVNYASINVSTTSSGSAGELDSGGIAGQSSGTLKNCYNIGTITGSCPERSTDQGRGELGGITGKSTGTIQNCYNAGVLTKEKDTMGKIGAVAGDSSSSSASIANCYYAAGSFSTGIGSGTGEAVSKTSAEMKEETFVTILGEAFNMDYSGDQAINSGYPVLKWQGGSEAGGNENLEAVTADRISLQLASLLIKEAGTLNLPLMGEHGTTISWSSSNPDVISEEGSVTLPLSGNAQVTLTATIKKGAAVDTKQFNLTVKSVDEATLDYLNEANRSATTLLSPVCGTDTNITKVVESNLKKLGYEGITVTLIDNGDEKYIAANGDITYFYIDPSINNALNFAVVDGIKFNFSKGSQSVVYTAKANLRWDRNKVAQTMTERIADPLTFDLIKGENTDAHAITTNLNLPQQVNGNAWATISWTSDNPYLTIGEESELYGSFPGNVVRPQNDTNVTLTAIIRFNKTGLGEADITVEKPFDLVLKGDDFDWPGYMQAQLNEKYTVDKLKESLTGKPIDPENVTEDIQLLIGRNTGIEKYFNYQFTASSSDPNVVKINGYRAVVYRPLPGEAEKTITLTISMKRNNTDTIVTKDFILKVQPLVQEEINSEIALMERVKASYAAGILDGLDPSQVTKNLHAFKECYSDAENNLVWVYDYSQRTEMGIETCGLPKNGYDESYNLFHSSEPTILSHENLVLAAIPQYDTPITITSNLQSIRFAKYVEKYPENADFKKLANQLVQATIIVKGSDGSVDPNPEQPETEVTVTAEAQAGGEFLVSPQTVKVAYDLAESYGYADLVKNHVSALDVLVKEHELRFGEAFTKETKNNFLQVGSNGYVSVLFERKSSDNGFAVNGRTPNDGIYSESNQGYTGYTINRAQIKDQDLVDFFIYGDTAEYSDRYTWFEEGREIEEAANVPFDLTLKGFGIARDGMKEPGEIKKKTEELSGAQLSFVEEDGKITPIENAVTDTFGKARATLAPGTYSITATRAGSTPILLPFIKVTAVSGDTLLEKKTAAVQELTGYKNSSDYREAQKQELENAIAKGTEEIDRAETFELVKAALAEAKKEIDAIKTNAQLIIEERIAKEQDAYDAIYESLKTYKGGTASNITIIIPYTGTTDEIQKSLIDLYLNVLFEHPELFYVKTEYKIEIEGKAAIIYPVIIEQFKDSEALTSAKNTLQGALDSAVAKCVFAGMTDLEKLLALHDWLVENCQYNQVGYKTGTADKVNAYTAYGALADGDAVCQGYAMALDLLLQKAGVESYYVSGNGHAWNVVKIAGTWYHVDSTWADATPDRPGEVKHKYFLLSDNEIKDQKEHSNWSTRYGITCSQSYTGDAPWKTSTLPFVYDAAEKAFFNVENQSNTTQYRKISFDSDGNVGVRVLQNLPLKNILAQIQYKGVLYLVDYTGDVYAYDLKEKVKKLLLDETIGIEPGYGLLIRGEKLIVRANYEDVEELELYHAEPISAEANKPSRIAAFLPAPGQFINKTEVLYNAYPNPEVTLENPLSEKVVSLGAYGGYIVYEFDQPITNQANNPYGIDFIVYGNGGNGQSEPGAVMVSKDGEAWYELAGSEYYNADTKRNLSITYTNPDTGFKGAVNVPWTTSDKMTGYIYKNSNHTQAYYPNPNTYNSYNNGIAANPKYSDTALSFEGNKISIGETVPSFGYADCHKTGSNNAAVNPYAAAVENYNGDGMDLEWAVDRNGNAVKVDEIKYVKIYTAVLEDYGIMGESSSEVAGIFAAQAGENAVGKTADLKKLVINGESIVLTPGKYDYTYDAADSGSLVVTATGESIDNIFINNKKVSSGTDSEPLALAGKVRILVQNGEKEPVIYVVSITGDNIGENSEAPLSNYLADLIITKLPDKTKYKIGEDLNIQGISIKAKYISGGAVVLKDMDISACTIEGFDSRTAGARSIKVSYYEDYYDDHHNFIKRIHTSAIFVVNVIDEKQENPTEKEQSVILTIKGAKGKTWTSSSYVINPGVTSVMDALKAVLALNGTTYTIKAGGKYISSIDGLGEFDLGKNSGWMVKVNDELIDVSAADWKLNGGEKILWFYTEDWTKVSGTKGWKPEEVVKEETPKAGETKTVSSTATVNAKTDSQGKASAAVGTGAVNDAISKVLKEAETVEKQGLTAYKEIVIEVQSDGKASSVETMIPQAAVAELQNSVDTVKLSTSIGELSFDNAALKGLSKEKEAVKLTIIKKNAEAAIEEAVNSSDQAKEKIKRGQTFEVVVTAGTKILSQVEGQVVIRVPYEKSENQKNEGIVAYEINSEGLMKPIFNGRLEDDGKMFKIIADHLSTYVLTYNDVNFVDTRNHWADSNITYLAAREIMKGMTESVFEPNSNLTRAQFIQILANLSGEDPAEYTESKFKDVNKDAWYARSAAWAVKNDLVTGNVNSDGTISFNPNDNITRQDMAVLLSRYMSKIEQKKLSEVNKEVLFTDRSQIGSYAAPAVKELQKAGVINGKTADTFVPKGNATRAECSKMIAVLMQSYL